MPTVAELEIDVDANDDATATLVALDALIKSMAGEDLDIEIDTNAAEAVAEVAALQGALEAMGDETVTVEVDVDGAASEIAALEAQLKAIPDEEVTIEVDHDRAMASMQELAAQARGASSALGAITTAALALGPALVPMLAVAGAGAVALGGGLAAAGVGAGLFGAVAVSAFSEVADANKELNTLQEEYNQALTDDAKQKALDKMKAVMQSLSPVQQQMVREIKAFGGAWGEVVNAFQPRIFAIATEGLRGLSGLLPRLVPIIANFADGLQELQESAFRALANPFWRGYFDMLSETAGPSVLSFGRIMGNLITVFAGVQQAFMPMTTSVVSGLESLTRAWARWAMTLGNNPAFQEFMEYVRTRAPMVGDFLRALGDAFIDLLQAAAPVGEALLRMATAAFEAFSRLQDAHPQIATLVVALIGLGAVLLNVIGPLASIAAFIAAVGATAALVVGGIALLIGAFVAALLVSENFRSAVGQLASLLWSFLTTVVSVARSVGEAIWGVLQPAFEAVGEFVGEEVQKAMDWVDRMEPTFQAAWDRIVFGVHVFMAIVNKLWQTFWPALSGVVQTAWGIISTVISTGLSILRTIFEVVLRLIAGDWNGLWMMLPGPVRAAFTLIGTVISTAIGAIGTAISTGLTIIGAVWGVWWAIFGGPVRAAFAIVNAVISAALTIIGGLFQVASSIIGPIWSAMWSVISTVVGVYTTVIGAVIGAWWSVVTGMFRAASTAVSAIWSAFWNGQMIIVRTITGIISGTIGGWIGSMISAITGFIGRARTAWDTGWATISATTVRIITSVRTTISTGLSAISSGITTFVSAITSRFSAGWAAIVSGVTSAMSQFVSAISSGVSRAVSAITGFATQAVGVVTGLAGRFFSAGASLISSLASGITSRIGEAVGAIGNVVGRIRGALPFSPAKWGPLSGTGYPLYAGRTIATSVAEGILSRTGTVEAAMRDLADLAMLNDNSAAAYRAITGGGTGGTGSAGGITIRVEAGAIQVNVGNGVSVEEARSAFAGAEDDLADKILTAVRRA